ncbi:nucleotidyltransferase domain-containing protein [Peribacillus frigoritolerans]|uniref:nucleotidyltransferase domain-containing protein n=1 Tax=Peribacillus frigoritolerans TaxID=450367 RepID=UPI002B059FBE|nr:nucleotidyltransferase family protein [Peribacillus frigoritolerans]MEA3573920.1 nucleotidyltransferase family protein [Peribacillus frigoritolerans]
MNNNFSLQEPLSKELELLLVILRDRNEDSIYPINSELFTNINWKLFIQLVRHHRVYPLIYLKLRNLDENIVPPNVIKTLHQEYKKNIFQMLNLSVEMQQVSKLFAENRILLLFLKGPVIANDIYGDISLRTSKDLDILISRTDLKRAEELLLNNGYERENTPFLLNEWKRRKHHLAYFHPIKRIQIEIHWRLHPPPTKEPTFDHLWERKRISTLTTYPVYFLGKEDLFSYLVSHGARHGWFRLRWLTDIDQMIKNGLNIEKVNLLLNKYQYHYMGGQALILASLLLNTPIPNKIKQLTEKSRSKKLAKISIKFIINMCEFQYQKDYFFSLKSNSQKFITILLLFYPSSADSETLKLPKLLHFLYFPLRPFLWTWRKTRKSS